MLSLLHFYCSNNFAINFPMQSSILLINGVSYRIRDSVRPLGDLITTKLLKKLKKYILKIKYTKYEFRMQ